ncbi:winged helix-turn-helix transcriptional regulator [Pseudomonas sp. N040]|uniref:winged helix-turn-helix transcriptional regulator n=1 Tax=Pseudomonas sp. N040 TaxID=2785325 RepID=UPI0018A24D8D|nr:winged helix-turn-helix transcriptional regulator [Pseudomonas sp. N040]MBF7728869.1 winged helix-turn-helix transcriptional regulator [Pseudomonas sp. N040]MBW7012509.1 winged helix-turn-helix transcriptional regulator [Pseudomonas sp. N040]
MPTHSTQALDVTAHVASSIVPAVLDVLGQRWSLALVQALLLQEKTFGQLLLALAIPRSTLAARLKHLLAMRCLEATAHGYRLSAAGQALLPVVSLAQAWNRGAAGQPPAPAPLIHCCGNSLVPALVCKVCAEPILARDIHLDCPGAVPDLSHLPKPLRRARAESSPGQWLGAAEILGDRWTALIVALGFYGVQRYSEIARHLAIAPNILADRLARLCDGGVLLRVAEQQSERPRYRFSEAGLQLFPLIVALIEWGDRWLRPATQAATCMRHLPCGHWLQPQLRCSSCGTAVTLQSLSASSLQAP